MSKLSSLLTEIKQCTICKSFLVNGVNPVLSASESSKILIIGQAPSTKVHASGIPWNDASGITLRKWMNISETDFYDISKIAIVPMGFCYPGKGKTGDLPPRKECAEHWHKKVLSELPNLELVILIGLYAQNYYLENKYNTLTENVKNYTEFLPKFFPIPHPSPRNRIWMKKNEWFEFDVLPEFEKCVKITLGKL